MLYIILMILKILGILLAVILGLLLLICLVILFVPVRYEVKVLKKEDLVVRAKVHWFLYAVFMKLWLLDQKLHIRLRILGYVFYDNLRPKKNKKKKRSKSRKKKRNKMDRVSVSGGYNDQEHVEESGDKAIEQSTEKTAEEKIEAPIEKLESDESSKGLGEENPKGKHRGFFSKIKVFFQKVIGFFTGFKDKIITIWNLIKALLEKKNMVMLFLKDEDTKVGIKTAVLRILDILKYCGPQRLEGYVRFGTGDPAGTGQLLSIAAIFYGMYGENIRIEPDFNNKVLETELYAKGRIRIIRLIIITVRLLRAHEFKQLIKNAKKLKEEL